MRLIAKALFTISLTVILLALTVGPGPVLRGQTGTTRPTLEPVAETKLIMVGVAQANLLGLEKILQSDPKTVQSWTFARGQALIVAESANLMMLRPPKGQGQDLWFQRAMALRSEATELARAAANRDYAGSRKRLVQVANTCNNCHRSFGEKTEIVPFGKGA